MKRSRFVAGFVSLALVASCAMPGTRAFAEEAESASLESAVVEDALIEVLEEDTEAEAPEEEAAEEVEDVEAAESAEAVESVDPVEVVEAEPADEEAYPTEEPVESQSAPDKDVQTSQEEPRSQATKTSFADVPGDHWAHGVITSAAKLGIIGGYEGTDLFGPEDKITRAQVVTILWRMAGKPTAAALSFSDVSWADYFAQAVAWASSDGVVSGYKDGKFYPNQNITREELAVMLNNYAERMGIGKLYAYTECYEAMDDASKVSSWARESVAWCFSSSLMTGSRGKLRPQGNATRAEAAKMIMRMRNRMRCPWQSSVSCSYVNIRKGEVLDVIPHSFGDNEGVSFTLEAKHGSWSGQVPRFFTVNGAGYYLITATARDANGNVQKSCYAVVSTELQGVTVTRNSYHSWTASAKMGGGVTHAPATQFRFKVRNTTTGKEEVIRDWGWSSSVTFDPSKHGSTPCKQVVIVEMTDRWGTVSKESSPYSVPQAMSHASGAQRSIVDAAHRTPFPGRNLCAAWVEEVYMNAGYPLWGGNACDLYYAYCNTSDLSQLKVGMIVAVASHPHTYMGSIYGHVAIYVGDGKIMENAHGSVHSADLYSWVAHYDDSMPVKWGWMGGQWLG